MIFMKKIYFAIFGIMFFVANGFAQSQTFNSTGTYIVGSGVTSVKVEAWGGGGGGGATAGGGGGGYASRIITVTPGNSFIVTVGAGGSAGNDGNNSRLWDTCFCKEGAMVLEVEHLRVPVV